MRSHEVRHNVAKSLSLIVSGAHLMTLRDESDRPRAILLSFVQQVTLDPPRLAMALYKERDIVGPLERRRAFVLNVLAEGGEALLEQIATAAGDPGDLLAALGARRCDVGDVLEQACGHLVCRVLDCVDIGDHWLYISEVVDGAAVPGRRPLVHARASGLRY